MLFWVLAAILTLGACLAVLLPSIRASAPLAADTDHDIEVYKDQLSELERDVARGVIGKGEAENARAEIGRRLLRTAGQESSRASSDGSLVVRLALTVAVLIVPAASWAIYSATGSPELPAQPLHARLAKNPGDSTMEELVARAEVHLAANPEDGRGWDVLGPIYFRMSRFPEAANAFNNAIRLMGPTATRETGLGEALASAAGGMITADAQAAFERALEIDPAYPKARYLLAAAYAQDGDDEAAQKALRAMLDDLPADSPWRGTVLNALGEAAADTGPAPGREEVEAASQMSEADRAEMIEGMVSGLAERLRDNPDDPAGWLRLVQSYVVLGRQDEAMGALERGLSALGRDSEAGSQLAALANSLGLENEESNQ